MTKAKLQVSAELLAEMKEYLSYDPETGHFTWIKKRKAQSVAGDLAGSLEKSGYIRIGFKGDVYNAHRLAWLFYYGIMPKDLIDHKNGNRSDNWITNLRECSNKENQQNQQKAQIDNKTGMLGVCWDSYNNRYKAAIKVDGKIRNLGNFNTPEEAHKKYLEEKRKVHSFCMI